MIRSFVSLLFFAALALAEPADWVIAARYAVTMDPARRVIDDGAVAVRGERILAVGPRTAILKAYQPKQRLDRPRAILLPGLVNAHAHAPMSLLRGIADDLKLQEWLEKYIFPAEAKNVTPEFVRWGTRLACLEMALSGVTTYADMYYFEEVVAEATKEAGLRGVLGETIINFPVPDARTPAEGLKRAEAFIRRFRNDPLIVPAVAPHAVYTNTEESLRQARALANRYDVPLLTHLSETKAENEQVRAKWGMTPAALLDQWGIFGGKTLVAHAVWVDEADRRILRERGAGVAHCPSSNTKLASGVAPVLAMLGAGLAVGLGTDGPAGSNNDFNLFEEMDLAAKMQKVFSGDPRALPARQALEMATILGARTVSLDKQIGSLEPGKRADLITVAIDQPHAVPLYDVYSQLVYALKAADVRDVMVNGRLILRERQSLMLNPAAILAKAEEFRAKISASLPQ
ncbi:MAG: amidohydrolase [Acidobacteria bacterium]|nr:amidohydrolase [Acidobacteriota bacterium]